MSRYSAGALARKYFQRARQLDALLKRALRDALVKIDRKSVELLSGSGSPGSYPVPVRSGTLRREHGWAIGSGGKSGTVFNTAAYAHVIHDGKGTSSKYGPRPFLDDAAESVSAGEMLSDGVRSGFVL